MVRTALVAVGWVWLLAGSAVAQTTTSKSYQGGSIAGDANAGFMWGTASTVLPGAKDSAALHVLNGTAAAQVNAARRGYLLPDNITIQSIGSQSIVSVTVTGNNNVVDLTASQTSSNSGSVNNAGAINAY